MPGVFSKSARPKRPGAYTNFESRVPLRVLSNTGSIVAVPFVHDWGPTDQAVLLGSYAEFVATYGSNSSAGQRAVFGAFKGEGLPGAGGAGQVLAYRFSGTAGAKASRALSNGVATALTLSARYEGTRGNSLTVTVRNAAAAGRDELLIRDGTTTLETWEFVETDMVAAAALINDPLTGSDWVTAVAGATGTALTAVTDVALTGGNDGTTLVAADWTAVRDALETQRFGVFAPHNLTDGSILASFVSWSKTLNSRGKRFMTVVGGLAGETAATAVTRTTTIDDPNFINLGVGTYTDDELKVDLSTAELAPRVAGILAARGERQSLTFARLQGLTIKVGATEQNILDALDNGVMVISRDSHPDAPVRLEKQLTAFVTKTDTTRPHSIYSVPKFLRTMHGLESEVTEFAEINVIGRLPVNDGTREYLVGAMSEFLARREAEGVIASGWVVDVDSDPPPASTDEFVALRYVISFGRSTEQVYNTVVVG